MILPIRSTHSIALIVLLSSFSFCLCADDQLTGSVSPQVGEQQEWARSQFKLPKLFDYQQFKDVFRKEYNSSLEDLARRKVFLAKVFRVFCSLACYKFYGCDYYLGLNQMSDLTPDEISRSKISAAAMRDEAKNFLETVKPEVVDTEPPVASEEDIERELERLSQLRPEIAEELANEAKQRAKRNAENQTKTRRRANLKLSDLIRAPEESRDNEQVRVKAMRGRTVSEALNPLYEPPELPSFGSEPVTARRRPPADLERLGKAKSVDLDRVANQMLAHDEAESAKNVHQPLATIDHRRSNCLFKVRAQGSVCGACYAFATVALYEWHYCMATGDLVAFSEQFIVDCGHKSGLNGCSGGNLLRAAMFVDEFGLELQRHYPYREAQGQCPYEPQTSSQQLGYVRLQRPGHLAIKIEVAHYWLRRGPLLVGLKVGPSFRDYAGGVHDNGHCDDNDAHGMLMVGSGREDGKEYFLIRNSHSSSWGEDGYYKLARDRFYACSVYGFAVMVSGGFKQPKQPATHTTTTSTTAKPRLNEQRPAPKRTSTMQPIVRHAPVVQPARPVVPVRNSPVQPAGNYYSYEPNAYEYKSRRQRILNFLADTLDPI